MSADDGLYLSIPTSKSISKLTLLAYVFRRRPLSSYTYIYIDPRENSSCICLQTTASIYLYLHLHRSPGKLFSHMSADDGLYLSILISKSIPGPTLLAYVCRRRRTTSPSPRPTLARGWRNRPPPRRFSSSACHWAPPSLRSQRYAPVRKIDPCYVQCKCVCACVCIYICIHIYIYIYIYSYLYSYLSIYLSIDIYIYRYISIYIYIYIYIHIYKYVGQRFSL